MNHYIFNAWILATPIMSLISEKSANPTPAGMYMKAALSTGYVTYHMYDGDTRTDQISCSDGKYGLMTMGHSNLKRLIRQGVTAANFVSWNSPQCNTCVRLDNMVSNATTFTRVIDQCQLLGNGYYTHFDVDPFTFERLFGRAGINRGHGFVKWTPVSISNCKVD